MPQISAEETEKLAKVTLALQKGGASLLPRNYGPAAAVVNHYLHVGPYSWAQTSHPTIQGGVSAAAFSSTLRNKPTLFDFIASTGYPLAPRPSIVRLPDYDLQKPFLATMRKPMVAGKPSQGVQVISRSPDGQNFFKIFCLLAGQQPNAEAPYLNFSEVDFVRILSTVQNSAQFKAGPEMATGRWKYMYIPSAENKLDNISTKEGERAMARLGVPPVGTCGRLEDFTIIGGELNTRVGVNPNSNAGILFEGKIGAGLDRVQQLAETWLRCRPQHVGQFLDAVAVAVPQTLTAKLSFKVDTYDVTKLLSDRMGRLYYQHNASVVMAIASRLNPIKAVTRLAPLSTNCSGVGTAKHGVGRCLQSLQEQLNNYGCALSTAGDDQHLIIILFCWGNAQIVISICLDVSSMDHSSSPGNVMVATGVLCRRLEGLPEAVSTPAGARRRMAAGLLAHVSTRLDVNISQAQVHQGANAVKSGIPGVDLLNAPIVSALVGRALHEIMTNGRSTSAARLDAHHSAKPEYRTPEIITGVLVETFRAAGYKLKCEGVRLLALQGASQQEVYAIASHGDGIAFLGAQLQARQTSGEPIVITEIAHHPGLDALLEDVETKLGPEAHMIPFGGHVGLVKFDLSSTCQYDRAFKKIVQASPRSEPDPTLRRITSLVGCIGGLLSFGYSFTRPRMNLFVTAHLRYLANQLPPLIEVLSHEGKHYTQTRETMDYFFANILDLPPQFKDTLPGLIHALKSATVLKDIYCNVGGVLNGRLVDTHSVTPALYKSMGLMGHSAFPAGAINMNKVTRVDSFDYFEEDEVTPLDPHFAHENLSRTGPNLGSAVYTLPPQATQPPPRYNSAPEGPLSLYSVWNAAATEAAALVDHWVPMRLPPAVPARKTVTRTTFGQLPGSVHVPHPSVARAAGRGAGKRAGAGAATAGAGAVGKGRRSGIIDEEDDATGYATEQVILDGLAETFDSASDQEDDDGDARDGVSELDPYDLVNLRARHEELDEIIALQATADDDGAGGGYAFEDDENRDFETEYDKFLDGPGENVAPFGKR